MQNFDRNLLSERIVKYSSGHNRKQKVNGHKSMSVDMNVENQDAYRIQWTSIFFVALLRGSNSPQYVTW